MVHISTRQRQTLFLVLLMLMMMMMMMSKNRLWLVHQSEREPVNGTRTNQLFSLCSEIVSGIQTLYFCQLSNTLTSTCCERCFLWFFLFCLFPDWTANSKHLVFNFHWKSKCNSNSLCYGQITWNIPPWSKPSSCLVGHLSTKYHILSNISAVAQEQKRSSDLFVILNSTFLHKHVDPQHAARWGWLIPR